MISKMFRSALLVGTAVSIAAITGAAKADTITASLFSPMGPTGTTPIAIDLTGITAPSQSTLTTPDYTVTFSAGFPTDQGIVQGTDSGVHAVPVAGETAGLAAEYMTDGFGSPLTTNIASSGNYFSTGANNTITITFTKPQKSLALLWGSIDTGNSLTLSDGFTATGTAIQAAATGFVSNGFQGPGGSAYVVIDSATSFTTVTATSSVVSFEFAGVAAATSPFGSVPEPATVVLFGTGLGIAATLLRRRQKKAMRPTKA
jgi:hypothetical protein